MATANVTIRMDEVLKKQAETLFEDMGMNMTTAFTVFAKAAVRQGKIPFEISGNIPNPETIAAFEEADRISRDPNTKRYSSAKELFADLRSECMK
jgi:DNA-damage-inducible protein J